MTAPAHENPSGVSSIELFFDLVFVFVITQVTQLVEHAHGSMDFLRALLVLVPIWWMYGGYVWLTNNVRANWQMRLVLIAALGSAGRARGNRSARDRRHRDRAAAGIPQGLRSFIRDLETARIGWTIV